MSTTLATKQDLLLLARKEDLLLLRQDVAQLKQEMLDIRARCKLEPETGSSQFLGSLDKSYYEFKQKLDEVERKLTIRFGAMFFSGCALLVVAKRYWT